MNNKAFNVRNILAGEAPKDAAITVKGWVRTRRDSKAGISGRAEYSIQLRR